MPRPPDPTEFLNALEAHFGDEEFDPGVAIEEVFGQDGPELYYARRVLQERLGEIPHVSEDIVAGVGVPEARQAEIDLWIGRYVDEWRRRFS